MLICGLLGIIIAQAYACWYYRRRAERDLFTGLYNKEWLFGASFSRSNRLIKYMRRTRRTGRSFGMLIVDLDGFKEVNDTLGHAEGDIVLLDVVLVIRYMEREYSGISSVRFGGDEMIVLCPGDITYLVARYLCAAIDSGTRVTASIGGAVFRCTDEVNQEVFFAKCDNALYSVKNNGKNGVRIV